MARKQTENYWHFIIPSLIGGGIAWLFSGSVGLGVMVGVGVIIGSWMASTRVR
jgi:hypothetical protein